MTSPAPGLEGIEAIVFRTIGDQAVAGGVGPSTGGPAAPAAKAASATRNGDTTGIAAAWTARPSPGFAGEFWGLAPTTRARTWTGATASWPTTWWVKRNPDELCQD